MMTGWVTLDSVARERPRGSGPHGDHWRATIAPMSTWKRWLGYAKTKARRMTRDVDRELDRREAELDAERAEKPWLDPSGDTPTMDEVRARIDHDTGAGKAKADDDPPPDVAVELEAQRRAASKRLSSIRKSLGLDRDKK
jgi:hypothetical protein